MCQTSTYCNFPLKSFAYIAQGAGVLAKEKVCEEKKYQPSVTTGGDLSFCGIGDSGGRK